LDICLLIYLFFVLNGIDRNYITDF